MPTGVSPNMLVVVDGHPNSQAGVLIAERYARGFVTLAGWEADKVTSGVEVQTSVSSEPSIAEAARAAAQRRIPWIAVRRDFAEPEALLGELLVCTARHADDELPGFAVFLADGEPRPFRRILAIVDQRDGPMSGLLAYAGVALADDSDAELDILVIGARGNDPADRDEVDMLAVSREHELFDRAVARARTSRANVNWIPAAEVVNPWWVVRDQLSQYDYDLVIDDLGDVSLGGRQGLAQTIEGALAPGAVGEIPLRLLIETTTPLLLVIDEIRLGIAPMTLLKAGTVAALSLGMVAAAVVTNAPPGAATQTVKGDTEPLDALISDLEEALDEAAADEELAAQERADQASGSSRGGDTDSARVAAESAARAAVTPTASGDQESEQAAAAEAEKKGAQEPAKVETTKAPKAPKGGADPADLAKAKREAAKAQAALDKDKKRKQQAKEDLAEAEEQLVEAQAQAASALAELQAATMSHEEAAIYAAQMRSDATGITGALPGGATEETAAKATELAESALDRLDRAVAWGQESLGTLTAAEEELTTAEDKLVEERADASQAKAEVEYTQAKVEVFRESLAESRQSPVAGGSYRLTARFGQSGGYWSSGIHTGLDFAGSSGTAITAAGSGTVVEAGWAGAYGNRIVVDHGNGYQTTYNHLSDIDVSVGQDVLTGDSIGNLGGTGNVTGPHLHFEVTRNGKFVDPESWLGW